MSLHKRRCSSRKSVKGIQEGVRYVDDSFFGQKLECQRQEDVGLLKGHLVGGGYPVFAPRILEITQQRFAYAIAYSLLAQTQLMTGPERHGIDITKLLISKPSQRSSIHP